MRRIIPVIVGLGLLWVLAVGSQWVGTPGDQQHFADRVNLALRQVGHQLLALEGDSVSAIPPVEVVSPMQFRLRLEQVFQYDSLPPIIAAAFASFDIKGDYHVAVERCEDDFVILGYNQQAYADGNVPCQGREQESLCNNLVITFPAPARTSMDRSFLLLGILILSGIVLIGIYLWRKRSEVDRKIQGTEPEGESASTEPAIISIGSYRFDHQNQVLQFGDEKQDLTFRESKLLNHLARHINEVQTRDTLIDEVWADEGVLVGRSLDVFISRLRKLLKADGSVSIRNIHGVGYRLEVGE